MMYAVLFWTGVGVLGFAFALAVQMRMAAAMALRLALADTFGDGHEAADDAAVKAAASGIVDTERAAHISATYPKAVGHISLARTVTRVAPILLLGLVVIRRLTTGGV